MSKQAKRMEIVLTADQTAELIQRLDKAARQWLRDFSESKPVFIDPRFIDLYGFHEPTDTPMDIECLTTVEEFFDLNTGGYQATHISGSGFAPWKYRDWYEFYLNDVQGEFTKTLSAGDDELDKEYTEACHNPRSAWLADFVALDWREAVKESS